LYAPPPPLLYAPPAVAPPPPSLYAPPAVAPPATADALQAAWGVGGVGGVGGGGGWAAEFTAASPTAAAATSVAPATAAAAVANAHAAAPVDAASGAMDANVESLVDAFRDLQAGGDALAETTSGLPPGGASLVGHGADAAAAADVAGMAEDWSDHFAGLDSPGLWWDDEARVHALDAGERAAADAAEGAAQAAAAHDPPATGGHLLPYLFVTPPGQTAAAAAAAAGVASTAAAAAATPTAEELLARGESALAARAHAAAIRWLEAAVRVTDAVALPAERAATAWLLLGRAHAECDADTHAIAALQRCLLSADRVEGGGAAADAVAATRQQALLALGVSCTNELDAPRATAYLSQWLDRHPVHGAGAAAAGAAAAAAPASTAVGAGAANPAAALFTATTGMAPLTDAPALLRRYGDLVGASPAAAADVSVHVVMGVLHHLVADYPAAADALRAAVVLSPTDARLWNKLGATLANGGAGRDALRAYRKAVSLDGGFIRAWVNVGTAYANEGDGAAAVRYYLKALSLLAAKERSGAGEPGVDAPAATAAAAAVVDVPGGGYAGRGGFGGNAGEAPHVWEYLRANLIASRREDLLPLVEAGDVDAFRPHVRVP